MLTMVRLRRRGLMASCCYQGAAIPWLYAPARLPDAMPRIVYTWPSFFTARPVAA